MAETTYYVDPDVSGGAGDGSSWANAYSSLNQAEQARNDDIRAGNAVVFRCACSAGTADTTAVDVSGWITDSDSYVKIYADGGDTGGRHAGVWSASKYRLTPTNASALTISEDYVRVDGIQIGVVSPSTAALGVVVNPASTLAASNAIWISNCLLKGHGNTSYTEYGISAQDTNAIISVWNTIIYNITAITGSRGVTVSAKTFKLYSSTVIGGQYGVRSSNAVTTLTAKNVYAGGTSSEDFYLATGVLAKTNCASEDQSADDTAASETATNCVAAAVDCTTAGVTFTDPANGDFRIADTDSALYGAGTDTSGESAPLNFTTDIIGTTRS